MESGHYKLDSCFNCPHLLQEGFSLDESQILEYLFDAQKSQIEQMRKLLSEGHRF